jgi:hypothetical protein
MADLYSEWRHLIPGLAQSHRILTPEVRGADCWRLTSRRPGRKDSGPIRAGWPFRRWAHSLRLAGLM